MPMPDPQTTPFMKDAVWWLTILITLPVVFGFAVMVALL